MEETISLKKETYDQLVQDRIDLLYIKDCLYNGYKTHSGDYERAIFIFERPFGGSLMITAHSESEAIKELNRINKELYELNNSLPTYKRLFGNLYLKQ